MRACAEAPWRSKSRGANQPAGEAASGAAGSGRERVLDALAGGVGGASQPDMQELVDAIIVLGHLPSQSKSSSTEEQRLARRLIKARKAGTLTWQQEAQLGNLQPATRVRGAVAWEVPSASFLRREFQRSLRP